MVSAVVGNALGPAVGLGLLVSGRARSCCRPLARKKARTTRGFCRRYRTRFRCRTLARKEAQTLIALGLAVGMQT